MNFLSSIIWLSLFLYSYPEGNCSLTEKGSTFLQPIQGYEPGKFHRVKHKLVDSGSIHKVTFEQDATYGSSDTILLGKIASVAVDEHNRVFIADKDQLVIHVYKPNGTYLTTLGRQGKGPGEFTNIGLLNIHSGNLYASDGDRLLLRVQVYSLKSLSFSHTIDLWAENRGTFKQFRDYFPVRFYPFGKKYMVAYAQPGTETLQGKSFIRYYRTNRKGKIISDEILKLENRRQLVYKNPGGGTVGYSFPFLEKSLFAMSGDGKFYTARSGAFKIYEYDETGRQIRGLQQSIPKKSLTRSELIERYKQKEMSFLGDGVAVKMIRKADHLPDTRPILNAMFVDDQNRIWVSTIIDNEKVYEWWVMKNTGEVITKFKWPRDKPVEQVRINYMYTRETDENGVEHVVRYQIKMDNE